MTKAKCDEKSISKYIRKKWKKFYLKIDLNNRCWLVQISTNKNLGFKKLLFFTFFNKESGIKFIAIWNKATGKEVWRRWIHFWNTKILDKKSPTRKIFSANKNSRQKITHKIIFLLKKIPHEKNCRGKWLTLKEYVFKIGLTCHEKIR